MYREEKKRKKRKVIGYEYDSFSELPGIRVGTCWTARILKWMLMYKEEKKKKRPGQAFDGPRQFWAEAICLFSNPSQNVW
jgi:hypothetical protein